MHQPLQGTVDEAGGPLRIRPAERAWSVLEVAGHDRLHVEQARRSLDAAR